MRARVQHVCHCVCCVILCLWLVSVMCAGQHGSVHSCVHVIIVCIELPQCVHVHVCVQVCM